MKFSGSYRNIPRIGATVLLLMLSTVVNKSGEKVIDTFEKTEKIAPTPTLPYVDLFDREEDNEHDLYNQLFENLHCCSASQEQFFDSLLTRTEPPTFLTRHERTPVYDTLSAQFPKAKKYEKLIEKSCFLGQGIQEYMNVKTDIDTLLVHHAPHLGSYDRYLSLSRKITKHAQKNNSTQGHYFLSAGYVRRLSENMGGDIINNDIRSILFPEEESTQSEQSETVFPDMSQTAPRADTIYLGKKRLINEHFPAHQALDSLQQNGRNPYGSKHGPDDGTSYAANRTCTHGMQAIVRQGLRLLEKKLYTSYQVHMDTKILRGGTEEGHFFGKNNTGIIAGQLSPSYNKKIRQGEKTNIQRGVLKELWFLLTTHGFGNTVDISIAGSNRIWAMEDMLKKGSPIGQKYKLMSLGDNIYALYWAHKEDISRHIHCSFVTGEQLQQVGLGAYTH